MRLLVFVKSFCNQALTQLSRSGIFASFILFILPEQRPNALCISYNILILDNSKVGIGYEKALRSQSNVPFFFYVGFKTTNPKFCIEFGIYNE